jgi:hypothetical protein
VALAVACDLRTGALCVAVPAASRLPHRGLDLRGLERALNEATPSLPLVQTHVVRALESGLLNSLASLAAATGLQTAPPWARALSSDGPAEHWSLCDEPHPIFLEATCSAPLRLSLRLVAASATHGKRPHLVGRGAELPSPEFSVPVKRRRRFAAAAHFTDALGRAREGASLLAAGASLLAGADWLAGLGLAMEAEQCQRLLSGGTPLRVTAGGVTLEAAATDEGLRWTCQSPCSIEGPIATRAVPLLCGGRVVLTCGGFGLGVEVPAALGARSGLACALAAAKSAWSDAESAEARVAAAALGAEDFLNRNVL